MAFKFGNVISASLLLAIVSPGIRPESCTRLSDLASPCGCTLTAESFDPICATDGNTYMNICFLNCQKTIDGSNIREDYKGICDRESQCTCPANYAPVCSNNGVTYSNECVLNCNIKKDRSIRLHHHGACEDRLHKTRLRTIRKCACNPSNGPICASDGVTYYSNCVMRCKTKNSNPPVTFKYWGECESNIESESEETFNGVRLIPRLDGDSRQCRCGVDSIEYFARCGQSSRPKCYCQPKVEKMKYKDPCSANNQKQYRPVEQKLQLSLSKSCECAAVNKPVCANNHETYANTCVLHCHAKKNPSIKFERWGTCGSSRLISRLTSKESLERDETMLRKKKLRSKRVISKSLTSLEQMG